VADNSPSSRVALPTYLDTLFRRGLQLPSACLQQHVLVCPVKATDQPGVYVHMFNFLTKAPLLSVLNYWQGVAKSAFELLAQVRCVKDLLRLCSCAYFCLSCLCARCSCLLLVVVAGNC